LDRYFNSYNTEDGIKETYTKTKHLDGTICRFFRGKNLVSVSSYLLVMNSEGIESYCRFFSEFLYFTV
jgi:hypothetical protein